MIGVSVFADDFFVCRQGFKAEFRRFQYTRTSILFDVRIVDFIEL